MRRPNVHELNLKLRRATEAVKKGNLGYIKQRAIYADLLDLDKVLDIDVEPNLPSIIQKITPESYVGQRPPERSYEREMPNCELFAFAWESRFFGCRMYFKFCLKDGMLKIFSLHQAKR